MLFFQNVKIEIFKYPWEHFPCVRSGHTAICGKKRGLGVFRWILPYVYIFTYKLPINHTVACMLGKSLASPAPSS